MSRVLYCSSLRYVSYVKKYSAKIGFFKRFIYLFLEKGREGEREGEKHQCVVASRAPPTGDLSCYPGVCPDWESNLRPFVSQGGVPSTEPHKATNFLLLSQHAGPPVMNSSHFSKPEKNYISFVFKIIFSLAVRV